MAKFCGGIKLDPESFEIIDGVICAKGASAEEGFDPTNTISACGQLWDGNIFALRNGVITFAYSLFEHPPVPIKGNCGIGLDGLYFKLSNGVVAKAGVGFLLDVNVAPSDATIKVIDINGDKLEPTAGTTNIFVVPQEGIYEVEVSKTGYITKTKTVRIDADHFEQTIEVTLEATG